LARFDAACDVAFQTSSISFAPGRGGRFALAAATASACSAFESPTAGRAHERRATLAPMDCVFCSTPGGVVLHAEPAARVVWPQEPEQPGLLRVIATTHARELTDLERPIRERVFTLVCAAETALRALLSPSKVNVASLGNLVPHVHWHVIPRFADDAHFPQPIWAAKQREVAPYVVPSTFAATVRGALARELTR
jgi:diadenosine tetraphosphate (Ap4A) HIT family hydrolase